MPLFDFDRADDWLSEDAPRSDIVVSSRARYARNLARHPFSPRAKSAQLNEIGAKIERAVRAAPQTAGFTRVLLSEFNETQRAFLKESHLISAEMEKGGEGRMVYFSPDIRLSLLVNEEDHIRLQRLEAGFRLHETLESLNRLDELLADRLEYAFHERFGFLTACPTNTGTGLRVSVMLNLPALVLTNTIESIMEFIPQYGLTVRGFYGENSEFLGDFFQISNEVTLGKTEERICADLERVALHIIEKEEKARVALFTERRIKLEDIVGRAYGTLTNSREMESRDALKLLSRLRLGVECGMLKGITHAQLSRLMIEVQPAHLRIADTENSNEEARDVARASLLRRRLSDVIQNPN